MAENILGSLFKTGGAPRSDRGEPARTALASLGTETAATFEKIVEASRRAMPAFEQTTEAITRLAQSSGSAFEQMRGHTQQWSASAVSTFGRVVELLQRHISVEKLSAVETGKAEAQKSLLHKAAVEERAVVEAVKEAAAGFAALGDFDFWSAAQHFASAALWGSLAALQISSAIGAFGGGNAGASRGLSASDSRFAGSAGLSSTVTPLGSSPRSAGAPAAGPVVIQMNVDGRTLGQVLIPHMDRIVRSGGARLTANVADRVVSRTGS